MIVPTHSIQIDSCMSTRFGLGAGFGGLLAIMALAGIYGIRVLQRIRRNDNQIRRQFLFEESCAQ